MVGNGSLDDLCEDSVIIRMKMTSMMTITMTVITLTMISYRNFPGGWGKGSKSFLQSSAKPWNSDYKGPHGFITIIIIIIKLKILVSDFVTRDLE